MLPVIERFIRYAKIDTRSDKESNLNPSTPGQLELAHLLKEEMEHIGMQDVTINEHGYIMGFVPGNTGREQTTVGFIAHLDTSPELSGENVNPRIIEKYKGGDILLNREKGHTLSPTNFPELANYIGSDLIVTDGNTLLGADDKAGIAEIITAMEHLIQHPEIKHDRIAVCFMPDGEIGKDSKFFDIKKFGAKFAYTLDGGELGSLEFENFNAAIAKLTFKGRNFHIGYGKNRLVNSIKIATDFISGLPKKEVPELTSGYEGFFHIASIKGGVEESTVEILIRDFDKESFQWRKSVIENGVRDYSRKYELPIELELRDQFYNMKEKMESLGYIVDIAKQAMIDCDIKPLIVPIRGGTNGVPLTFMGLPTPNISNGAHNAHGRYEYIPIPAMLKATKLIVRICELCTKV